MIVAILLLIFYDSSNWFYKMEDYLWLDIYLRIWAQGVRKRKSTITKLGGFKVTIT
jgi:hypothetical protein